jgi:hypothetical protein
VAAGLIVEVAVADERSWWRALAAALLLAAVLATGEMAQTAARHAGWAAAFTAHRRAGLASMIGIAAVTGAAAVVAHDATLAAVRIGIAAAAALLTLLVVHVSLRE